MGWTRIYRRGRGRGPTWFRSSHGVGGGVGFSDRDVQGFGGAFCFEAAFAWACAEVAESGGFWFWFGLALGEDGRGGVGGALELVAAFAWPVAKVTEGFWSWGGCWGRQGLSGGGGDHEGGGDGEELHDDDGGGGDDLV